MRRLAVGFFFVTILGVSADPTVDQFLTFLPAPDRAAVQKEGSESVFADRLENLRLWKGGPFEASVQSLFKYRESTLAAEALFVVPVNLPSEAGARDRLLARAMTSVSTMKGLQVYSISLKRMETFIFDAYRTPSLKTQTRLPDPDPSTTTGVEFTMFQSEEQTGESFFRYSFLRTPSWFQVTQTNLTSLNYGIIPLVSPGDFLTAVYVVPMEGTLVIYGVTTAKTMSLFGLERTRTASLYTRMEALVTWFRNGLKLQAPN